MQLAGDRVDLEEKNKDVEDSQGDIGSHDVPEPVPAGTRARDAGHVEGVNQWVVVWKTPPAEGTSPVVELRAHAALQGAGVIFKLMIEYVVQVLTLASVLHPVIFTVEHTRSGHCSVALGVESDPVAVKHRKFEVGHSFTGNYLLRHVETLTFSFVPVEPQRTGVQALVNHAGVGVALLQTAAGIR